MEYSAELLQGTALILLGWLVSQVNMIATKVIDLWNWHRPNAEGIQTWKGDPEAISRLIDKIDDLTTLLREFIVEMRGRQR